MFFRKYFLFIFLSFVIVHIFVHIKMYNNYMNNSHIIFENIIEADISFKTLYKKNNDKIIANLKNFCLKNNIRALFNDNIDNKIIITVIFGDKELLLNEIFKTYKLTFNAFINENIITLTNNDIISNNTIQKETIKTLKFRLKDYKNSVKLEKNKLNIIVNDYSKLSNEFLNNLFKKSYLSVHFGFFNSINNEFIDVDGYNKIKYKVEKNEVFSHRDIKKIWIDFSTKRAILKIKFKNKKIIEDLTRNNQGKILTFLVDDKVAFQTKISSTIFNGTFQELIHNYDEARKILNILQIKPFSADVKILSEKINFKKYREYFNICKFIFVLMLFSIIELLLFNYYNKLGRTR